MGNYIPEECLRKFPELEDFLCYGCDDKEMDYRDGSYIYVCKSLAMKIWNVTSEADLNKPSTRFDGCGLLAKESNNFASYPLSSELNFIIPSKVFNTFEDFINTMKIPYYSHLGVKVDYSDDESNCFSGGKMIGKRAVFTVVLYIILSVFV